MAGISRENMGNATSLFNLLRNMGGSIGIAGVTTLVTRHAQAHVNTLGEKVTAYNPKAMAMMAGVKASLQAKGVPAVVASKQAYGAMWGMVVRDSMLLSYLDVFQILAVIFLCMIPLVLLTKKPDHGGPAGPVH